jgi:hypothetical protein
VDTGHRRGIRRRSPRHQGPPPIHDPRLSERPPPVLLVHRRPRLRLGPSGRDGVVKVRYGKAKTLSPDESACAEPLVCVVHRGAVVLKIGQQISVAVNRAGSVGVPPR